jgi:quinol monooxygenase YgiN
MRMFVAEFTLHAKPGHYRDVVDVYSAFVTDFLSTHPALESAIIVGDEASGLIRGIGVWETKDDADSVNSNPEFAAFNDAISPLLAVPADRVELELVHAFSRSSGS